MAQPAGLAVAGFTDAGIASWRTQFGWTPGDLIRSASSELAGSPLQVFQIFDTVPGLVTDAVHSDPVWSGSLRRLSYLDHDYFGWDNDPGPVDPALRSGPRPDGLGGRLAIVDDVVLQTSDDPSIRQTFETVNDVTSSLGDDAAYRLVAERLDSAGAYTAVISGEPIRPSADALIDNTGRTTEELIATFDELAERAGAARPVHGGRSGRRPRRYRSFQHRRPRS